MGVDRPTIDRAIGSDLRLAVIGGGWAGLAAAVRATEAGYRVTLFEMAGHWGGRARGVDVDGLALDNGQHILIGAYLRTLALMATVGADAANHLHRQPLELRYPDGRGLRLPQGPAWLGFGVAVAGCVGWSWRDRLMLMVEAGRWALAGFRCAPALTVDALCRRLPPAVRQLLINPLCVAALNTPAAAASAQVFLRVLQDALFSGQGSADLLLPRRDLGTLLPVPAAQWLSGHGASLQLGKRVMQLRHDGTDWLVDEQPFAAVILACSAHEAARLAHPHAPAWAAAAQTITYEPIVTVYLHCSGAHLPSVMTALIDGPEAPAQYAFDHGALGASPGVFAFVISGARAWADRGLEAAGKAVLQQALSAFPPGTWPTAPTVLRVMAEKRATFRCTPALARPPPVVVPGLIAAGDYITGPYPATLEGAVRSGEVAVDLLSP